MEKRINNLIKSMESGTAAFINSRANIFYYSGFTSPDAYLYISENERVIITDSRYTVQAKQEAPDFELYDIRGGMQNFFQIHHADALLIEERELSLARYESMRTAVNSRIVNGSALITRQRYVKDKDEIRRIEAAETLGDAAFSYILPRIKAGRSEREIALELEFFMLSNGAQALSFETIAASGARSAMPHGAASGKLLESGDLFTLDFGCVLDGYCSDMTRTVAIGSADSRARDIYQTVLSAQKAALDFVRPGMTGREADAAARRIITDAGYGECFGHSLGHSVGIEIHENPNFSPRSDEVIAEGNVVTFEPGIYIEGFGGVRIEDVGVIEKNGVRNITHSPKELMII